MRYVMIGTFARWCDVNKKAIENALDKGRIKLVKRKGKKRICWETEFPKFVGTSTDPQVLKTFGKMDLSNSKGIQKENRKKNNGGTNGNNLFDKDIEDMDAVDAQSLKAIVSAKTAQLTYEKEVGNLIEIVNVKHEWENICQTIKSALLSIPDRVSSQCEGLTHAKVHILLTTEIKHCLEELAKDIDYTGEE